MVDPRIVIVADDDSDVREALAAVLRQEGLRVYLAENGRVALDLLDTMGDDRCVLLLDLMMPVLSGFDVLCALACEGRLASLPVIVCSALGLDPKLDPSLDPNLLGAPWVLTKPFDLDKLLALIEEVSASYRATMPDSVLPDGRRAPESAGRSALLEADGGLPDGVAIAVVG